jgi:hypothetical protein
MTEIMEVRFTLLNLKGWPIEKGEKIMQKKNLSSPGLVAPEPLPSQSPEKTPSSSVGSPPFSRAFLPRMQKEERTREMRRSRSPRGYEESDFRTLMRILGKGGNESPGDVGRRLAGSDQSHFHDPARH